MESKELPKHGRAWSSPAKTFEGLKWKSEITISASDKSPDRQEDSGTLMYDAYPFESLTVSVDADHVIGKDSGKITLSFSYRDSENDTTARAHISLRGTDALEELLSLLEQIQSEITLGEKSK